MELGVNIDHVATLRQARGTAYPDPADAVLAAEAGGADLITLHLREDRRHIVDDDVYRLRGLIGTRMNLEMAATDEMSGIACKVQPNDVCLVPEKRAELTTEGGLDVAMQQAKLQTIVQRLQDSGIRVSMFINPEAEQIAASAAVGADAVEIHTGVYADSAVGEAQEMELERVRSAVQWGLAAGLRVNGGHGLNYDNVGTVAGLAGLAELNIGHAIIARSVFTGLEAAVAEMKSLMRVAAT
ncbi:MAG: pyridoxine 5'-phosphate synthase [Arenicellales bacterium]|jgi:pyridoxine 5-phosphate synthase|nr:pyridoxine 5'-phosphate synthase [Arenicellales bacterium]MDP6312642.1 pyridoxine 5'-phosphate synthase [Arenicellales bacterium]MDP7191683.1 pyridoxine 5'-phosphate synthase [Arenicellales bacterium]MDP7491118.1 pyridoxine 5'-phosphate synthase [Arenicellales bacterium]MEE1566894.1 pyridoxine 5'-phosphate synthase [Arenicellales bacterium]